MKSPKIVSLAAFLLASSILFAQNYKLKNDSFEIQFSPTGTITSFRSNGENIEFRKDNKFEGPAIVFANNKVVLKNTKSNATDLIFSGETSEIGVTLSYSFENTIQILNKILFEFECIGEINIEFGIYIYEIV